MATVRFNRGSTTIGPYTVTDTQPAVEFTIADWGTSDTLAVDVQMSFDGGTTWRSLGGFGPTAGNRASFRGSTSIRLRIAPMALCDCGEVYIPDHPLNDRLLMHSTVTLAPGVTLDQFNAALSPADRTLPFSVWRTRIAVDGSGRDIDEQFLVRVFHTPTWAAGQVRRVRCVAQASARITTDVTVV